MNHRREGVRSPRRLGFRIVPLVAGSLALAAAMQTHAADDGPKLESDLQRLSYMIGLQVGQSLRQQGLDAIDAAALAAALDDVFQDRRPRLTREEMQAAQAAFQAGRAARQNREATDNLAAGKAFFASNAGNEGVEQTPDGLQYRVLRAGDGATPTAEDRVVVHYRGRLLDGTEFDSSYGRGEPTEFMLGAVIPGWQAALQLMQVGSHWEVWIPPELAYGERGAGGAIGPNQALHFEIELLEITPKG